jgi:hypothetical protein
MSAAACIPPGLVTEAAWLPLSVWLSGSRQSILIFGMLLLVSFMAFAWAAFFRRRPRQRVRHHHHRHIEPVTPAASEQNGNGGTPSANGHSQGRRRRVRREHRPRNPTLAETRGLPPIRGQAPPPPP